MPAAYEDPDFIARVAAFAERHQVGYTPHPTGVPGLVLMRAFAPSSIEHLIYRPLVCLILQGAKEIYAPHGTVLARARHALVASYDIPVSSRITQASRGAPYLGLALDLDPLLLQRLAERLDAAPAPPARHAPSVDPEAMVGVAAADARMVGAMERLFELREDATAASMLRSLVVEEIHYWLLTGPQGPRLRALSRADSHGERIARAIARIRAAPAATHSVPELARLAGMSASAFHQHFKALTSVTPLQFQKQLKLAEARRLLQSGRAGVAEAAFQVGYESSSQFSREYARMFGHPPVQEITQARSA